MRTELFIALRYLKPRRNAVSVITLLSIIGVMLGVAVMIVVLAVMTGFTDIMKEKLIQTQAHLHVSALQHPIEDIQSVQEKYKAIGAVHSAPVINQVAMLQNGQKFTPKLVMGVLLEDIKDVMDVERSLVTGTLSLEHGEAILGSRLAAQHGLRVGDKIILHSSGKLSEMVKVNPGGGGVSGTGRILLPTELTVTGLVSFGKYDFDRDVIFVNLDDAAELFNLPWGSATSVYGWVKDPFNLDRELQAMTEQMSSMPYPVRVESWQTRNAQLLGVLTVEKNMMFFLLIFIVLVAAFSIANTLITSVYQKTREIGLLKALGSSPGTVRRIFVLQGLLVGVIGSTLGVLLGVTVIAIRMHILNLISQITGQQIFPPEMYYFNELPAHIVPMDVAVIVISSILLCTAGAIIPAMRAAKLDPARALRYE